MCTTDQLLAVMEFVNRRWVEWNGEYPTGEESATIVQVVAALEEFHALHCAGTQIRAYRSAVPARLGSRT